MQKIHNEIYDEGENNSLKSVLAAITTCKRKPEMVERAIKSVVAQTYTDWDLVVVDDSPSDYEFRDDVRKMVEGWSKRDSRIRYVPHDKNYGASHARNTALRIANSTVALGGYEFIAYLDDDDEWLPEKLEKQIERFSECDENTALVVGGLKIVYDNIMKIIEHVPLRRSEIKSFFQLAYQCGTTTAPLIRTECINAVGGFDENLPAREDWEMWMRIVDKYKVEFIYEPLFIYHDHDGIHVSSSIRNHIKAREIINSKYREYLEANKSEYWAQMMDIMILYYSAGEFKKAFRAWRKAISLQPTRIVANITRPVILVAKCEIKNFLLKNSPTLLYYLKEIKKYIKERI